jgi:hypothetical protein
MLITAPLAPGDFQSLFQGFLATDLVQAVFEAHGPARRRPPKLPAPDLVAGLVFHSLAGQGKLSTHVQQLTSIDLSDAALSERRAGLRFMIFEELLALALAPKACPDLHPEAFYQGLRLCGLDGSSLPIANTPQVKGRMSKAASRRAKAAFARVGVAVLVELGLHNPLAASVGTRGDSEMSLAEPLLARLPEKSLLIADRYYGVPKEVLRFRELHPKEDRHFLMRVRRNLRGRVLEAYADGSALVEIRSGGQTMLVREIRGRVGRGPHQASEVRLWTSLLDGRAHPAGVLLALYGRRWEHEGFYRELKVDLRGAELVQSHTPETAAQEIAAFLLGYAMLVEHRMKAAAAGAVPVLRISFRQTLAVVRTLWTTLALTGDLLSQAEKRLVVQRALDRIAAQVSAPRRSRSCPRAVRQPVGSWPRLKRNTYQREPVAITVTPVEG